MLSLAFLGVASGALITPEITQAFQRFQTKYGKTYASGAEFTKRLGVFADNLEMVNRQNEEHILMGGEAVFGITKFMDLTPDEFKTQFLTYQERDWSNVTTWTPPPTEIATSVDWVAQGLTTPVKDQGQCGSCWAFSATEAIESYAKLSGKYDLMKLSPQQITACDKTDGGCNGGNTETAYQYVKSAGGIETEASYPYTAGTGITGICKAKPANFVVSIDGYTSVTKGEDNLKTALNAGPVSVCLAATAFQTYTSGILKMCPGFIDHCVQAVGYDDGVSTPYWTIRNSWNTDWGEKGYIRIEQGKDLCKVANDVTFPTFA
jgi:C1A family cysteine protease